jgi:hypothetical protein
MRGARFGVSPWWRSPSVSIARTPARRPVDQPSTVRRDVIHAGVILMKHRIAVAACAAVALFAVACSDTDTRGLATEPGPSALDRNTHYSTTGVAAVVGANHLRASASVAAPSGQGDPLIVNSGEPGIAKGGGYRLSSFIDGSKHRHTIAMLYPVSGGPPVAVQHYVDGKLVSTNAFTWSRAGSQWVRTRSFLQSVRDGRLYGTYTTTTSAGGPVTPPGGGGGPKPTVRLTHPAPPNALQRALGTAAYDLAFAFAPDEANAQSPAFSECSQQWLRFAGALAAVISIELSIAEMPVITPVAYGQLASALAALAAAEDALLDCVLAHQPTPLIDNWSTGMGSGSGGGSGSGSGGGSKDCLEGSYAAHCSTALTL